MLCDLASPPAAGTYLLSVDRAAPSTSTAQLTFYDREVPPFLYSLDPPEGAAARPASASSSSAATLRRRGRVFALRVQDRVCARARAGDLCERDARLLPGAGAHDRRGRRVAHRHRPREVAHDGMSYRQSNLQFTYASGCYPATSTTVSALIILALLALAAALVWVDRKRKEQIRETMSLLQERSRRRSAAGTRPAPSTSARATSAASPASGCRRAARGAGTRGPVASPVRGRCEVL